MNYINETQTKHERKIGYKSKINSHKLTEFNKGENKMEKQENIESSKSRPVEYSIGNVKVLEWTNTIGEGDIVKSYTCQKFYKDSKGEWQSTNSFNFSELQMLENLIRRVKDKKLPLRSNQDK